ncbi:hypothetical protein B2J88_32130 [Rhodococcus sp. SRB_17]|nr:hypothetical protein [Rhodococcus sp. SRB_17]
MTASFEELSTVVLEIADAYREHRGDLGPPYKPRCRAWDDRNAERRFVGEWSQMPVRNMQMEALGFLGRAEDHLRGCGHLVAAEGVVFSPVSLGRTVLTATATAFWMLDPDVDATERIRRSMNIKLRALDEQAMHAADSDDTAFRAKTEQAIADIQQAALSVGLKPGKTKTKRNFVNEFGPSDTQLLRDLVAHLEIPLSAEFLYRIYSAAVHANPNSTAHTDYEPNGSHHDGVGDNALVVDLDMMARYVQTPAYAFYVGCIRTMEYFGQRIEPFDAKALPALQRLSALTKAVTTITCA